MSARPTPRRGTTTGNFIAEWFGHRVWPDIDSSPTALGNQGKRGCPFLSAATGEPYPCVKTTRGDTEPTGVCTISSDSNGTQQDWLACPYRTLDAGFTLQAAVVRTLYRIPAAEPILIFPVTVLRRDDVQRAILAAVAAHTRIFTFSADKLGGEVDLPETDASPGSKVDVSIVEILAIETKSGLPSEFGKHAFYEVQTSDFHGSPMHAVQLLRKLCPRDSTRSFYDELRRHPEVCGTGVEGPNKANVFKRMFYQMLLKIQLAQHPMCAGFALVLPGPVWDSWTRHLGVPTLFNDPADVATLAMAAPGEDAARILVEARTWIFVTEIDRAAPGVPQPLKVVKRIATTPDALTHQAFTAATDQAISAGVVEKFRDTLARRVTLNWALGPDTSTRRERLGLSPAAPSTSGIDLGEFARPSRPSRSSLLRARPSPPVKAPPRQLPPKVDRPLLPPPPAKPPKK